MNFWKLKKTWIIAEIGVNHEGSIKLAADMIRLAAQCGVDAVKFQTYKAEHYVSSDEAERFERAKRFQLSYEAFRELANIAGESGLIFFSTPLHADEVDFLDEFTPIFKISSGDLTHLSLIRHIAAKGKLMIISTGLGTEAEIKRAIDTVIKVRPDIREKGELALLHCIAAYPAPVEEANLAKIGWLSRTFQLPTGYSDHTLGIKTCELAVAAGAIIIEKHFTYRKENQAFHDHAISADPQEMRELVGAIREVEIYRGTSNPGRTPSEEKNLIRLRRSIGAKVNIPAGVPIQKEWLIYLRPACGVPASEFDNVVGKRLSRDLSAGNLIKEEDII